VIAMEERETRQALREHFPESEQGNALWETVRSNAKALAVTAYGQGQEMSWSEALNLAGRALVSPNIQQAEQAKLASSRRQTLQQTAERGITRVDGRILTPEERDRAKLELLDSGRGVEEVRSAFG